MTDDSTCDCGAATTGKWAGMHHPNCSVIRNGLITELREHEHEYPSLIHAALCGRAADVIERQVAEHARGFAAGIEAAVKVAEQYSALAQWMPEVWLNAAGGTIARAIRALLPPVPQMSAYSDDELVVLTPPAPVVPVDGADKWQKIAAQGVQIEHKLRIEIEQLRAQLAAMRAALEQCMIGCNHIATYRNDKWPQVGTDYDLALEKLGAGREYDMWCCWNAHMTAARPPKTFASADLEESK